MLSFQLCLKGFFHLFLTAAIVKTFVSPPLNANGCNVNRDKHVDGRAEVNHNAYCYG